MPAIIYKDKDGKRVPSVTTILGQWGIKTQALIYWAWNQGEAGIPLYEKKEADIGTLSHLMIENEIREKELDLSQFPIDIVEAAQVCLDNWHTWKKQNKFKPVATEISLISEKHKYGGTLDIAAMINDKLSVTDIKTGKEVYEDHIIQIIAYAKLWEENFPDHPLDGGYHIIRTGKEIASFSHNWYGEFPGAWKVFKHLRALYDLAKQIKKLK